MDVFHQTVTPLKPVLALLCGGGLLLRKHTAPARVSDGDTVSVTPVARKGVHPEWATSWPQVAAGTERR